MPDFITTLMFPVGDELFCIAAVTGFPIDKETLIANFTDVIHLVLDGKLTPIWHQEIVPLEPDFGGMIIRFAVESEGEE